jgi:hypothetical protein
VIVYAVVGDSLSPTSPLGEALGAVRTTRAERDELVLAVRPNAAVPASSPLTAVHHTTASPAQIVEPIVLASDKWVAATDEEWLERKGNPIADRSRALEAEYAHDCQAQRLFGELEREPSPFTVQRGERCL